MVKKTGVLGAVAHEPYGHEAVTRTALLRGQARQFTLIKCNEFLLTNIFEEETKKF